MRLKSRWSNRYVKGPRDLLGYDHQWSAQGEGATVTLDLYTNSRKSFNPPFSRRAITHYEEDAIGLGVWSLDLELEHLVVVWHHLELNVWKRHVDNSVVELCTTNNGDEAFLDA